VENSYSLAKGDYVDLGTEQFMMAFGVKGVYNNRNVDDPNYVKWVVEIIEADGNMKENRIDLGYHRCEEEEYERFYPPNQSSLKRFEGLKKEMTMFCLDRNVDLKVAGEDEA
jgi:hypothetical protein